MRPNIFQTQVLTGLLLACVTLAGIYAVASSAATAVAASFSPATRTPQVRIAAFNCEPDFATPETHPPKHVSLCMAVRNALHKGTPPNTPRRGRYPPAAEQETRSQP